MSLTKDEQLRGKHSRIRKRVIGTPERLRLSVHRSHLNLNAQLIDDYAQRTLFSASTLSPTFRKKCPKGGNVEAAKLFGQFLAAEIKKKGFSKIVFDRGGYLYHGRIKAVAESLRENGVEF